MNDTSTNGQKDEDPPEVFSEAEELDDDLPEIFDKVEELDDDLPEIFDEAEELDDDLPEIFDKVEELDDDLPEVFSEAEELDDDKNQENGIENKENIDNPGLQPVITILANNHGESVIESEIKEIEDEPIEISPEEYEKYQEPIVDQDEIEFISHMEELGHNLRESTEMSGDSESKIEEDNNIGYNAEQAYEKLKNQKLYENQELIQQEEIESQINEEGKEGFSDDKKDELPEQLTDPEEIEYLWEKYEKFEKEGLSSEEIAEFMHEAEETYEKLKEIEEEFEKIQNEQKVVVDHSHEEQEEDYKEEIDNVDEIEYLVDAEEKLAKEGKTQEEVDVEVEKYAELYHFQEGVKELREQQEKEKLRLVDHENEEEKDDYKEETDRLDIIEQLVNTEEDSFQQGKSQEEIYNGLAVVEKEFSLNETEELKEEDTEKIINKEFNNEQYKINEVGSEQEQEKIEESEEEFEKLKQLYHQETGKRSIYAGRKTKGFTEWLEQQELNTEKLREEQVIENEEPKEYEDWQQMLKTWIKESPDEELNSELKELLNKIIENYQDYEVLLEKFLELFEKRKTEELKETEQKILNSIVNKIITINPILLRLYLNISGFKAYFQKHHWWNPWLIREIKSKFLNHLTIKYQVLERLSKNLNNKIIQNITLDEKLKEKIRITDAGINLIKKTLKNYSHDEISAIIGYEYNSLINKRNKIKNDVFNNLKSLMKVNDIPHEVYIGNKKKIIIENSDDVDELIGVMLGDGNLGLDGSKFSISLNSIDEERYVSYLLNKLKTIFYDKQPEESRNNFSLDYKSKYSKSQKLKKPDKTVEILCYSRNLHYFFVERGLIPGNKVTNQVSIPKQVFKERNSKIKCIKGLFDTDGNIHADLTHKQIHLGFNNASKSLVAGFKSICNDLGIKTGKVLTSHSRNPKKLKEKLTFYSIQIIGKDQVKKFLKIIDPEKIKEPFRKTYLGTRLILASAPKSLINLAKKEIKEWNLAKKQHHMFYTKENTIFLRELCERLLSSHGIKKIYGIEYTGKISDEMCNIAINNALSYVPPRLGFKKFGQKIVSFPRNLRYQLSEFLFRLLITPSALFSDYQLVELIRQEIKRLCYFEINKAMKNPIYKNSLIKYFKSLILLIRNIIKVSKSSNQINAKLIFERIKKTLSCDQYFSYDIVLEIFNRLIEKFPENLDIRQIEFKKIINYLLIHGKATKQEIAKIIEKRNEAAYNRLTELEKKNLVKRTREKIGDPTYWLLKLRNTSN